MLTLKLVVLKMKIKTAFNVGDTVYRRLVHSPGIILAHTIVQIKIEVSERGTYVEYNVTRNTGTKLPSGGDFSGLREKELQSNPYTRMEVYKLLFEDRMKAMSAIKSMSQGSKNRSAAKFAVINTNYAFYHQYEL